MNKALLSSRRHDWETPHALVRWVEDRIVGRPFYLDACARDRNASKAVRFYSPEQDGLLQPWEESCWCNPPYGSQQVGWVKRAFTESKSHAEIVVCLLPARTDTKLFHEVIAPHAEVILLKGRIRFLLDGIPATTAPFPSMLAVFSRYRRPGIWVADWGSAHGPKSLADAPDDVRPTVAGGAP